PLTDLGGKTCIFSHPVYLFLREFSLQDSRGGSLQTKGVRVVSLREGFDLSTPIGKAMLTMMAGLADLEKDLISERRKAGIERAKAEGVHMGRPVKASSEAVQTLISQGKTRLQIQEELGISKATYYRLAK
ncbi:recombinase family protein, partial [Escherichia coli]